jgi:hypothetical protein
VASHPALQAVKFAAVDDDEWLVAQQTRNLLSIEKRYGVWAVRQPLRPTKYHFGTEVTPYRKLSRRSYAEAFERQESEPVKLHEYGGRSWWWFRREVYVEYERLTAQDVMALALQLQRNKNAALQQAHAEMKGETAASARPREPITRAVRHEVWRRDQGRCVDCGSRKKLEFDHIIPWSQGGSNTTRNVELRCEACNRRKTAAI